MRLCHSRDRGQYRLGMLRGYLKKVPFGQTTLALIGAIVAEYFGSPTRGMGFRISTGVGSLSIDLVWAEIAVAALAGTAFYGTVAFVERIVTFWHPSQRG